MDSMLYAWQVEVHLPDVVGKEPWGEGCRMNSHMAVYLL